MSFRWAWMVAGLGASLAVTVLMWFLDLPLFFVFLFLPFLFWRPDAAEEPDEGVRTCPRCERGYAGSGIAFCPVDGTELQA